MLGFFCVLLACLASGFAVVWFEKILKASKSSIRIRNTQIGMSSIFIASLGVMIKDRALVAEKGFCRGYSAWVISVIVLQAIGGLVVAAVVKYADTIFKGFGSSISIIILCLIEILVWLPTLHLLPGTGCSGNYSVYMYPSEKVYALKP